MTVIANPRQWRLMTNLLLLILIVVAALVLPSGAHAQMEPVTLVSNTGQPGDAGAILATDHGQAFTAGYNLTGYTVSSVVFLSWDEHGDDIVLQICGVGADGNPTTSCTDLTPPDSFPLGRLVFNAPTDTTLTLASRTTYMVVFKNPGGNYLSRGLTSRDGEDSSSLPGWEVANHMLWKSPNGWTEHHTGFPLHIAINGTTNPPSSTAPTASDSTVNVTEDTAYAFAAADFSFSATADGDMLTSVRVVTLPALGTLTLDGSAVSMNQSVAKTQLDNGGLVYTPPADGSGTGYTSFRFRVSGGSEASADAYLMTIDVTGVEDPGAVALSRSTPVVGRLLTATLTDPDGGVTGRTWTWSWSTTRTGSFTTISGADTATYTPAPADDGRYLKASATYTDSFGGNQSAAETSANTTGTTLVSNTGQGGDASARFTTDHGQAFTTGYNLTGYTVTSVEIISEDWSGDDIALQICGVGADGSPTTSCTDLTPPGSFPRGRLVFNAPTDTTLTLASRTTYMVVFKSPGGEQVKVDATGSDGEDSSSIPDWAIRNRFQWNNAGTWQNASGSRAIRIAIVGTVNPPSATAPTAMDSTVTATEDTAYAFAATDFSFSATAEGDMLASVQILTLPALGTLTLDGSAVSVNQSVAKTYLDNGGLVYTPPADGSGTGYTSFRFRVSGGSEASADAYLMTIDVTGVEDPGAVALSRSTPVVGRLLTATLTDPDGGVTGRTWTWSWSTTRTGSFTTISGADTATYTPAPADDGRYLKASATYTDSFGGNQSAAETSANTPAGTTLVSNTGQGGDASARFTTDHGQAFTTGYNLTGYTVTSVEIISQDSQSDDIALQICGVGADGNPTTSCTDLTAPGSFPRGRLVFNAPTDTTLTLASRTTYMVVFKSPGGEQVKVDATGSDGEDSSSIPDWAIRNRFQWNNAGTWQNASRDNAIRIAIVGKVNPPSSTAPTAMDSTVTATEDTAYAFAAANFSFSATADGDTLASVQILTLPARGTFTLSGTAVTANQSVAKAQLDAQNLVYTPPADGSGTGYASFRFRVSGGSGTSADAYSMTIDVTGTQDAATGAPTFSGSAKVGLVLTAITTGLQDPDGVANITTYQWIRVDGDGTSNPTNVGTNSNRYALTEADFGKRIKVRVDFTDGIDGAESRTSAVYPADGTVQRIEPVLVPQTWGYAPQSGNQPIFGVGEQYRLLVITGVRVINRPTDANNRKDGAFYNRKVVEWVGDSSTLRPYKDGFTALVSTTGDSSANPPVPPAIARDNTETTGTGVPIYWYRKAKVADDYADFYDGSWDNGDASNEHGGYLSFISPNSSCAWTGSTSSGMPSDRPLGSRDYITFGCPWADGDEIDRFTINRGYGYFGFYALSPVLQVNTPPTSSNGTVTTNEGTDYVFSAADFSYSDSEGEPLASVIITGLPAAGTGTVKVGNTVIRDRYWLPWPFPVDQLSDGRLKYDPPTHTYGTGYASFKFRVNDGTSNSAEHTMTINVTSVEDPGTVALSPRIPVLGEPLTATLTDPDGDVIGESWTWSWSSTPTGSFTPIVGVNTATYTPVTADVGRFLRASVTYTDSFGENQSATQTATNATAAISPPVFPRSSETFRVKANEIARSGTVGTVTVTDPDNDIITYSVSGGPDVTEFNEDFSLDPSSGQITVKPTATIDYETNQWYMVTITATNTEGNTATVAVTIDVTAVNDPATGVPTISGAAQVGQTLTASTDGIADPDGLPNTFTYQWKRYSADGANFEANIGDNASTYTLTESDEGKKVTVEVSFTDSGGSSEGPLVSAAYPSSETVGAARQGRIPPGASNSTVSTDEDTDHTFAAADFNYLNSDGANLVSVKITGLPAAGTGTLALDGTAITSTDLPKTVTATELGESRLTYTARANANGAGYSSFTFKVNDGTADSVSEYAMTINVSPVNDPATGRPTISGSLQVGETLTASTAGISDIDGTTNASYSYRWMANDGASDADLPDATDSVHTLVAGDAGKTIKVRVSFTDDAGNEETLTSAATAEVAAGAPTDPPGQPRNLTGVANSDGTVTLSWEAPNDGTVTGYQILRRRPSEGENTLLVHVNDTRNTATEYTDSAVTPAVLHAYRVKAINAVGLSSQSNFVNVTPGQPTEPAQNSPATGTPQISGTAQVGETLTASTSHIADSDGLNNAAFSYRWIRNDGSTDTDIQDATGASHTLVDADEGRTIKVEVNFADDAGNAETLTSAATTSVAARPNSPATGAPTISGTAQVGERLTADTSGIEDDDGLDDAAFAHQWLADGAEINGATAATYTLVAADAGKAIKVQVSFTDDAGNDEELTSAATAAVAEAEPAGPPPAPRNLTAVVNGDGHVVLSWEAPEDDSITGYQILRRRPTEGEDTLLVYVEDTQSTATTYTDTNVTAGVQHAYRVRAINAAGASPVSNFVDPTP